MDRPLTLKTLIEKLQEVYKKEGDLPVRLDGDMWCEAFYVEVKDGPDEFPKYVEII